MFSFSLFLVTYKTKYGGRVREVWNMLSCLYDSMPIFILVVLGGLSFYWVWLVVYLFFPCVFVGLGVVFFCCDWNALSGLCLDGKSAEAHSFVWIIRAEKIPGEVNNEFAFHLFLLWCVDLPIWIDLFVGWGDGFFIVLSSCLEATALSGEFVSQWRIYRGCTHWRVDHRCCWRTWILSFLVTTPRGQRPVVLQPRLALWVPHRRSWPRVSRNSLGAFMPHNCEPQ